MSGLVIKGLVSSSCILLVCLVQVIKCDKCTYYPEQNAASLIECTHGCCPKSDTPKKASEVCCNAESVPLIVLVVLIFPVICLSAFLTYLVYACIRVKLKRRERSNVVDVQVWSTEYDTSSIDDSFTKLERSNNLTFSPSKNHHRYLYEFPIPVLPSSVFPLPSEALTKHKL